MREHELNAVMGVVSDPIKCVYNIDSAKSLNEIQRIIRIFQINEEQKNKHRCFQLKNLAALRLVLSNN